MPQLEEKKRQERSCEESVRRPIGDQKSGGNTGAHGSRLRRCRDREKAENEEQFGRAVLPEGLAADGPCAGPQGIPERQDPGRALRQLSSKQQKEESRGDRAKRSRGKLLHPRSHTLQPVVRPAALIQVSDRGSVERRDQQRSHDRVNGEMAPFGRLPDPIGGVLRMSRRDARDRVEREASRSPDRERQIARRDRISLGDDPKVGHVNGENRDGNEKRRPTAAGVGGARAAVRHGVIPNST